MKIEVLGTGCKKCVNTAEQISEAAQAFEVDAQVEKVTDPAVMMRYGVMSTPAVVIDGELVHSGSVPGRETIESWLRS